MHPQTILQVNKFHYLRGGAERSYLELSHLLQEKGHMVVNFSTEHPRNIETPWSRFFVSPMELGKVHGGLSAVKKAIRMIYSFESKQKMESLLSTVRRPDIAHLHNIYHHLSPSILPVLKSRQIPVVMTLHDYKLLTPNYRFLCHGRICEHQHVWTDILHRSVKDAFAASTLCVVEQVIHRIFKMYEKYVDCFIAPSAFMRVTCIAHGIPKEKIVVLPHMVDLTAYTPLPPARDPYILFVGRLSEEKGIDILLEAMERLPNVRLKIVGEGPMRENVELRMQNAELRNVELLGFREGEELKKIIAESRALVVPSRWYENAPFVIYEALALARPVIATRVGGIPELVHDGKTGILFPLGNDEELARHIAWVVHHPDLALAMGQAGRAMMAAYDTGVYYKKLMDVYGRVLSQQT